MNFIKVQTIDGWVLINVDSVVAVYGNDDGTSTIVTGNDMTWTVIESVQNIMRTINFLTKGD